MQTKNLQSALPASEGQPEVLLGGPQDGISLPHSRLPETGAGVHPNGAENGPNGVSEVKRFRVQLVAHPPAERMKFLLTFTETGYRLRLGDSPYSHALWFGSHRETDRHGPPDGHEATEVYRMDRCPWIRLPGSSYGLL